MEKLQNIDQAITLVAKRLRECHSLLFITGAGISVDSGLPTYRGVGGLYDVDPAEEGYPIEEILSAEMLARLPELTWKYLLQIGEACRGATYNRGHAVLAEMERYFDRVWIVTQNVDGLHHLAGSRNVIDLHGSVEQLICTSCRFHGPAAELCGTRIPPLCPRCQSVLRPDVVLFGEMLPADKLDRLAQELHTGFDMVLSVGTSSVFDYIAWPVELARRTGKYTVEINPGVTEVSHRVDIRIPLGASEALDAIWRRYQSQSVKSAGFA